MDLCNSPPGWHYYPVSRRRDQARFFRAEHSLKLSAISLAMCVPIHDLIFALSDDFVICCSTVRFDARESLMTQHARIP